MKQVTNFQTRDGIVHANYQQAKHHAIRALEDTVAKHSGLLAGMDNENEVRAYLIENAQALAELTLLIKDMEVEKD
jgi:hypothetical protein